MDILKLDSHILDKIQNIYDHDLFYSKDSDENLVDLIIDRCEVLFLPVEKRNKSTDLFSSEFICSYRFNAQNKMIVRLKPGAALKLQQMQPEKSNNQPQLEMNEVKSDDKATDVVISEPSNDSSDKLVSSLSEDDNNVNKEDDIVSSHGNAESKRIRSSDSNEEQVSNASKRRKSDLPPVRHALLTGVKVNNNNNDHHHVEDVFSNNNMEEKRRSGLKSKDRKRRGSEESEASVNGNNEGSPQTMLSSLDYNLRTSESNDQKKSINDGNQDPRMMVAEKTSYEAMNHHLVSNDKINERQENSSMLLSQENTNPEEDAEGNLNMDESLPQQPQQDDEPPSRVEESIAFQRMCLLMRDQVISRYSSTAVLSEEEIMSILEDLWGDMEDEDKEVYFTNPNNQDNPEDMITQPSSSNNLQTLELIESEESSTSNSENTIEELQQQGDDSSDNTSSSTSSDDEDDENVNANNKHSNSNVSTLMTRSMAAKAQEPFMLARLKSEQLQDMRIGWDYQADIPSLNSDYNTSTESNDNANDTIIYSLISTPSHFNSEDYQMYLSEAMKRTHDVLFNLLRVNHSDVIHRIDGTCVILATPIEIMAMEIYNEW